MNDDQDLEQFMIVFGCPFNSRQTLDHFDLIELLLTINNGDKILKRDGVLEVSA